MGLFDDLMKYYNYSLDELYEMSKKASGTEKFEIYMEIAKCYENYTRGASERCVQNEALVNAYILFKESRDLYATNFFERSLAEVCMEGVWKKMSVLQKIKTIGV